MSTQPLDQSNREQCLDDVLTVYFKALDSGEQPGREQLFEHYPELAEELREFFTGQDRLELFAAPLRPVVQAARQEQLDTRVVDRTAHADDGPILGAPPASIGEYLVIEEIAHGGMGIVYKARHRQLHRLVALKVLLAGPFARTVDLERFRSETEIVASLDHPNIVPIYDVGEHDRQPYFSMKLIQGDSLTKFAPQFRSDPRGAARLVAAVARAVHHAHQRGILHRDLKPSNVLLDADGIPYLTDFGLARWVEQDSGVSHSGAIVGTPSYMAPEQALGRRQLVTTSSDVYGLGAILYFLLTGNPPFRGETALDTLKQLHDCEPERPRTCSPNVPRDLETICLRCLAKDPRKRYGTAQDLADDLTRFVEHVPIKARTIGRRERLQKWVWRKPAQAALLAVSFVAFVAFVVGGVVYEHRLRGAWARAEASASEAQREKLRADSNYRQARETLVRILQKTNDRDVGGLSKLKELARRQNEEAIAFYLKIAEQAGDEPEIRQDRAMAQREAALLQHSLGMTSEAVRNLKQASAQFADLLAQDPGSAAYAFGKACCLNALAGMCPTEQEFAQDTEETMAIYEKLLRDAPEDVLYRLGLATCCNQMAILRMKQTRFDESLELYARAIRIREEVLQRHPEDRDVRANLAETCVNYSMLAYNQGKREKGKELHDRAEAELTSLLAENPHDFPLQTSLATLRVNWAYVLRDGGNLSAAIAELDRSIRDLEPLLEQEPNAFEIRDRLYRSHGLRAEMYGNAKQFARAMVDAEKSLEYSAPENVEFRKLILSLSYAQAGMHAKSIRQVKNCVATMSDKTQVSYRMHLATVCGLSATAAQQDLQLGESARVAAAAECKKLGIQQLQEVRKALGYLNWILEVPGLMTSPELAPLRATPEWINLLRP